MTNLKLFNAPAGSGKSTEIKQLVRDWSRNSSQDRMLCVTFTNRAADELLQEASADNVDISTIHSFILQFMEPVFSQPNAIQLYFNTYKNDIETRIANPDAKPHISTSNSRYEEKLGKPLTFEKVAQSISKLSYTETSHNSLLSGGLSHNALLFFANLCMKKFPALSKRVSAKYQQIIIDEYQDTDTDILEFFLTAIEGTSTALHLYGDPMQQIHQLTTPKLRSLLRRFQSSPRTVKNFRSSATIVNSLNRIYNDPKVKQEPNSSLETNEPRIHLCTSPKAQRQKLATPDTLILSARNATIFESIEAKDLYSALNRMQDHRYGSRYTATDVLTEPDWLEVKNPLLQRLFGLLQLESYYKEEKYGKTIQILDKYPSLFGFKPIRNHLDKDRLRQEIESLFDVLATDQLTIQGAVEHLAFTGRMKATEAAEYIENSDYAALLSVPFEQVRNVDAFSRAPQWSTQHGVKGESHEKVIFLAEQVTGNVNVRINTLFNLWPRISFNLSLLEDAYIEISAEFLRARNEFPQYTANPRASTYDIESQAISEHASRVFESLSNLPIFTALYQDTFLKYLNRPNTTNAKGLFSLSPIEGLLTAYRLFYVGCSRAKYELDIIVDQKTILDAEAFTSTFENLGFTVISPN